MASRSAATLAVAVAAAVAGAPGARAGVDGPDRLSILGLAAHLDPRSDFETAVPGAFLTWEGSQLDLTVGAFSNSYGRMSVAGFAALPVHRWSEGQIDLFAGLAHYPEDGRRFAVSLGDWVPLGGIQARWRQVFVQLLPSDGVETDAIVTFGVTLPLGR